MYWRFNLHSRFLQGRAIKVGATRLQQLIYLTAQEYWRNTGSNIDEIIIVINIGLRIRIEWIVYCKSNRCINKMLASQCSTLSIMALSKNIRKVV